MKAKKNTPRKLLIGGLRKESGWEVFNAVPGLHVDHEGNAIDLSRFGDNSFAVVYASHVLEHFDYVDEIGKVLAEWYRVLDPGGTLYVAVPDLQTLCELFAAPEGRLSAQDRFTVMRMMFGGHGDPYDYHKVGMDQPILVAYLSQAGFVNIRRTNDFGLFNDTSRGAVAGVPISLNLIARKPD
ncbi:MAG: methyltransferase domain-containing protein [Leptospirillia bacterium]